MPSCSSLGRDIKTGEGRKLVPSVSWKAAGTAHRCSSDSGGVLGGEGHTDGNEGALMLSAGIASLARRHGPSVHFYRGPAGELCTSRLCSPMDSKQREGSEASLFSAWAF